MLQAALLAGIAFNNAYLGLSHAICQSPGGHFHIAHGLANAIMLPYVMEYNVLTAADKYAAISKLLGLSGDGVTGRAAALGVVEAVENLARDINIPARLRDVGAKEA